MTELQVKYEPRSVGQFMWLEYLIKALLRNEARAKLHRKGPGRRNIVREHEKIVDKHEAQKRRAASGRYDWSQGARSA